MAFEIGKEIAALRKAAGLTQEELGKAVGVSTQAVSRWECGGTPDITLLPAVADRLGVSIDRLFGRDGEHLDISEAAALHYTRLPDKARYQWLCKLLWQMLVTSVSTVGYDEVPDLSYASPFLLKDTWVRSRSLSNYGFLLGSCSEPLHFFLAAEEPEAGFGSFLSKPEVYEKLFRTLALPHSVEILLHLFSRKDILTLPQAVAKQLNLPLDAVQTAMAAMGDLNLLFSQDFELENGVAKAYAPKDGAALTMFLLFGRWLMENQCWCYSWEERGKPYLRKDEKIYAECQPKNSTSALDTVDLSEQ